MKFTHRLQTRRFHLALIPAFTLLAYAAGALDRPADPVVITGSNIVSLNGIWPDELVAFRYQDGWQQIPVQVDERAMVNFTNVYNGSTNYGSFTRLDYVDEGTFTGPDPNPEIDADDELVFMVKDVGNLCSPEVAAPPHTLERSGVQVEISDPLGGNPAYVYLFQQDGELDPSAGVTYVNYDFNLLSGDYRTTYDTHDGPNPEDTTITTNFYERHFSDRWKSDVLRVFAGDATGEDILDRHKNLFFPGICGRSEDTFSDAEGAFITNKVGPIRAIRNYVGANSGPRTQRLHIFYEQREDITTFLRVHPIQGIMDFFDYSPDATGMTYLNNNWLPGVTIDGVPETIAPGALDWEMVRGTQGALAMMHSFTSDVPGLSPTNYYLDDAATTLTQCTGDAYAYGSSGHWVVQNLPNTDPKREAEFGELFQVEPTRIIYYLEPEATVADAQNLRAASNRPLVVTCQAWEIEGSLPAVRPHELLILLFGLSALAVCKLYRATNHS